MEEVNLRKKFLSAIVVLNILYVFIFPLVTILGQEILEIRFIDSRTFGEYNFINILGYIVFSLSLYYFSNEKFSFDFIKYFNFKNNVPYSRSKLLYILIILIPIFIYIFLTKAWEYGTTHPTYISMFIIATSGLIMALIIRSNRNNIFYGLVFFAIGAYFAIHYATKLPLLIIAGALFLKYARWLDKAGFFRTLFLSILMSVMSILVINIFNSLRDIGSISVFSLVTLPGEFYELHLNSGIIFYDLFKDNQMPFTLWQEFLSSAPSFLVTAQKGGAALQWAQFILGSNYKEGLGFGLNSIMLIYLNLKEYYLIFLVIYGYILNKFNSFLLNFLPCSEYEKLHIKYILLILSLVLFSRGTIFALYKPILILIFFIMLFYIIDRSLFIASIKEQKKINEA